MALAYLVLAVHLAIIGFNLFGLVAIPLGARRGWAFVHAPLWRALHGAACGIVALQAAAGRACFLTIWQDELAGASTAGEPLIMRWVNSMVYWPLPMRVFTVAYAVVFAYVLALLWLVPPGREGVLRPRRADGPGDARRGSRSATGSRH